LTILEHLIAAAREMDPIFERQAWEGNPALWQEMQAWQGPAADAARALVKIHKGPWDRIDELKPFIGAKPHPDGAGFYPEDMTKAEFEDWIAKHPEQKDAFTSLTTVIRREAGGLVAVPYSKAYAEWLGRAAQHLGTAAGLTANASLETFLEQRAKAFVSDDYFESDMAWMDLDAPVEVTIGPYETYEDGHFGYKAAFEAFVTVALPQESAALGRYKERLPWLEKNLPIPDADKNLKRGTASPIRVVDSVFASGDARRGVMTIAFNLPNDERVRGAKVEEGAAAQRHARQVDRSSPIAQRVLAPGDAPRVSFDAFFNEVLHHELSHGLGPGTITRDGKKTEVRLELKDLYSTLEEAKADVMGIYNILALIGEGDMPKELRDSLEPTYVAGLFRAARFGLHEAHGQGVAAQFNYCSRKAPRDRRRGPPRRVGEVPRRDPRSAARHADAPSGGRLRGHQGLPARYGQATRSSTRRSPSRGRGGRHQPGLHPGRRDALGSERGARRRGGLARTIATTAFPRRTMAVPGLALLLPLLFSAACRAAARRPHRLDHRSRRQAPCRCPRAGLGDRERVLARAVALASEAEPAPRRGERHRGPVPARAGGARFTACAPAPGATCRAKRLRCAYIEDAEFPARLERAGRLGASR
jgi:hypothetical protein